MRRGEEDEHKSGTPRAFSLSDPSCGRFADGSTQEKDQNDLPKWDIKKKPETNQTRSDSRVRMGQGQDEATLAENIIVWI